MLARPLGSPLAHGLGRSLGQSAAHHGDPEPSEVLYLVTEEGDRLVTEEGDPIIVG